MPVSDAAPSLCIRLRGKQNIRLRFKQMEVRIPCNRVERKLANAGH